MELTKEIFGIRGGGRDGQRRGPEIGFAKSGGIEHHFGMSTVQEIKSAIAKLSIEEQAEILSELCGWTEDDWDRQMKSDAAAGKFAALNKDADRAHTTGQTRPLTQILTER